MSYMKTFLCQMDDVLELAPGTCKPNDSFRSYENWNSLAALGLFCVLTDEYGVVVSNDELDQIQTFAELYDLVQTRTVKQAES